MYNDHFGLTSTPFTIAPDPRFLYMGKQHEEAQAHLLFGLRGAGGFIQLTGEVGTGKTTLVRSLVTDIPEDIDVALVLNPRLNALEFIAAILDELQISYPAERMSVKLLVDLLNRFLLDSYAKGRRVVLIVDEAQNLQPEVLEQIRLLTNLETNEQKLLQIVLVGQPELAKLLGRYELRQLAQRITARYHLTPLTEAEVRQYIEHRLATAGSDLRVFTDAAIKEIYKNSRGIPRLVNVICDRALLGAYSADQHTVDRTIARKAAEEVSGRKPPRRIGLKRLISPGAALAGVFAIGGTWALTNQSGHHHLHDEQETENLAAITPELPELPASLVSQESASHEATSQEPTSQESASELDIQPTMRNQGQTYAQWFQAWHISDAVISGDPCAEAVQHGLSCLEVTGTVQQLIDLDRPALIHLQQDNTEALSVVILGIEGNIFRVAAGDQTLELTRSDLENSWPGKFTVMWKPLAGDIQTLKPGQRHAAVNWLRRQLSTEPRSSRVYDDTLVEKIVSLQKEANLAADGVITPATVVYLQNKLNSPLIPRLSRSGHEHKG